MYRPQSLDKSIRTGDYNSYAAGLTTYNKEIRQAKIESFMEFCNNMKLIPTR